MAKTWRIGVTWLCGIMLVLGQFLMSAHACEKDHAKVMSPMSGMIAGSMVSCQDEVSTGHNPSPLCLAHCKQDPQHVPSAFPAGPSAPQLVALFEWPKPRGIGSLTSSASRHPVLRTPHPFLSPPLRLTFRVFRI